MSELSEIIRRRLKVWKTRPSEAHWINEGACDDFADEIQERFPWAELVDVPLNSDTIPSHTVLKYRGRYYDAEVPDGVRRIADLPVVQRIGLGHR